MAVRTFSVNGRVYPMPTAPVVVICVDGSEPAYHEAAVAAGRMPWLAAALGHGASAWPAESAMPTLTNPNNVSIATGRPPRVHGISGNYFYDAHSGSEVLMNEPRFLRAATIFAEAARCGLGVAVVTAKDKLRRLLGAGLVGPTAPASGRSGAARICFSAERADATTVGGHGIGDVLGMLDRPLPAIYSADLSEFTLAAGAGLMRHHRIDLMFLSLSDYIQHKHPPGSARANDFYAMIDSYAALFDDMGAILVITGDHGMNAKTGADGAPAVVYLEEEIGRIVRGDGVRVVLPITDPYPVHHGALGSSAYVHLPDLADAVAVATELSRIDGIATVSGRAEAAARYELPADRIGDLVVCADAHTVLGHSRARHAPHPLDAPLRSHGGPAESAVPFIVNRAVPQPQELTARPGHPSACVHNYDAFWVATRVSQYTAGASAPAAAAPDQEH